MKGCFFLCWGDAVPVLDVLIIRALQFLNRMLRSWSNEKQLRDSPALTHHLSYQQSHSKPHLAHPHLVHFQLDHPHSTRKSTRHPTRKPSPTHPDPPPTHSLLKRREGRHVDTVCRLSDKDDEVMSSLMQLETLRLPLTLRKNYGETTRIITSLLNSAMLSRSSIMRELKVFMSYSFSHDSYLLTRCLTDQAKQQLKAISSAHSYNFRYDQLAIFIRKLQEKCADSQELLNSYALFLRGHTYPPSVQLMATYIAVYLYSINSHYATAEELCKQILDLLLKHKLDTYIPVYLILMVKLKASQGDWQAALPLISRTLAAAWLYRLQDLEIWCYFEFSRAHFSLGDGAACAFFRERSQMSVVEGEDTIFREMVQQDYQKEVERMRSHNYYFDLSTSIGHHQLTERPPRLKHPSALKAQVYAKVIAQNFKIKHVKNLIGRLGEESLKTQQSQSQLGNPQLLTHQSGIKNLNVYFRMKQKRGEEKKLYTFENSSRNTLVLKEMARNLLLEMKWFVPILDPHS